MTNVIDWILDLFRDPVRAQEFVADPSRAMVSAGVQNVTAAQLQAVAASVAPAAVIQGGGNPVHGLQQAVAQTHGIAFTPERVLSPDTNTEFASHNSTDFASHNSTDAEFLSPDQHSGANSQAGAFNLGFGDITLGDHTEASGHAVVTGDNNSGDIVSGDGAVLGNHNDVNNGDIRTGAGSNVTVGHGNDVHNSSESAGGDIIQDNKGPVISKTDASAGDGGSASAHGGGGLINVGDTGANAGGGGAGGIHISDSSTHVGDETSVATHGDGTGGIHAEHQDDNSDHSDHSTHDSHDDNSTHIDDHSDSHNLSDVGSHNSVDVSAL